MQKKVVMSNVSDPGANNLNRFAGSGEAGIKISPQQTLTISAGFILVVFVLHILGKLVGFSAAPAVQPNVEQFEAEDVGAEGADQ